MNRRIERRLTTDFPLVEISARRLQVFRRVIIDGYPYRVVKISRDKDGIVVKVAELANTTFKFGHNDTVNIIPD